MFACPSLMAGGQHTAPHLQAARRAVSDTNLPYLFWPARVASPAKGVLHPL